MASIARSGRKWTFVTLTQYDVTYSSPFIFAPEELAEILGEIVARRGKRNCASPRRKNIAHVTYFFNGGMEKPFPGEDRKIDSVTKGRDLRFSSRK